VRLEIGKRPRDKRLARIAVKKEIGAREPCGRDTIISVYLLSVVVRIHGERRLA